MRVEKNDKTEKTLSVAKEWICEQVSRAKVARWTARLNPVTCGSQEAVLPAMAA
jgi:hypothetical protein